MNHREIMPLLDIVEIVLSYERTRTPRLEIQRIFQDSEKYGIYRPLTEDEYKDAIGLLQEILKHDPYDADLWNKLGHSCAELEQHQEALEAFKKAVEIDPDFAVGWSNLGTVYKKIQDYPKAMESAQRAMELAPDNGKMWRKLGSIHEANGRNERAKACYERAEKLEKPEKQDCNGSNNDYESLKKELEEAKILYKSERDSRKMLAREKMDLLDSYTRLEAEKAKVDAEVERQSAKIDELFERIERMPVDSEGLWAEYHLSYDGRNNLIFAVKEDVHHEKIQTMEYVGTISREGYSTEYMFFHVYGHNNNTYKFKMPSFHIGQANDERIKIFDRELRIKIQPYLNLGRLGLMNEQMNRFITHSLASKNAKDEDKQYFEALKNCDVRLLVSLEDLIKHSISVKRG